MAVVKRLAAHKARPRRKGDAAGETTAQQKTEVNTTDESEDSTSHYYEFRTNNKLTSQVEIGQDNTCQEPVHVKLDAAVLHVLRDDGLHRAESQHAGLVDLPPIVSPLSK